MPFRQMVLQSDDKSMADLAAEAGVGGSYFSRILRVGFLAPDIVAAILQDRHPLTLTAKRLASRGKLPANWDDQWSLLSFA